MLALSEPQVIRKFIQKPAKLLGSRSRLVLYGVTTQFVVLLNRMNETKQQQCWKTHVIGV